jgi:hypothetical protein
MGYLTQGAAESSGAAGPHFSKLSRFRVVILGPPSVEHGFAREALNWSVDSGQTESSATRNRWSEPSPWGRLEIDEDRNIAKYGKPAK